MGEWSVACDCVCMWLDEAMVSGLNDCDYVAQVPPPHTHQWGSLQHRLKTQQFSVDHESVCTREREDKRKSEKIQEREKTREKTQERRQEWRQERRQEREDRREREDQRDVEMGIKSFSSEDWHWLDWMESTPTPLQPTQPITAHFKQLYTLLFNLIIFSFWLRADKIQILVEFEWPHFSLCFLLSLPSYFFHSHKTFYATYQIQHTTMSEKGQLYS